MLSVEMNCTCSFLLHVLHSSKNEIAALARGKIAARGGASVLAFCATIAAKPHTPFKELNCFPCTLWIHVFLFKLFYLRKAVFPILHHLFLLLPQLQSEDRHCVLASPANAIICTSFPLLLGLLLPLVGIPLNVFPPDLVTSQEGRSYVRTYPLFLLLVACIHPPGEDSNLFSLFLPHFDNILLFVACCSRGIRWVRNISPQHDSTEQVSWRGVDGSEKSRTSKSFPFNGCCSH